MSKATGKNIIKRARISPKLRDEIAPKVTAEIRSEGRTLEIIQQIISEWKSADQSTRQQVLEFLRASSRGEDPIFAAIEQRRKLEKVWGDLYSKIDVAERRAGKKHGQRPTGERAEKAWDRRAGIAVQRRECDRAINAESDATMRLAKTRPTTPAGAAVMLEYLKTDAKPGEMEWHSVAFDTIIATISTWTLQAK
jgi:hypothetical protein